MPIIQLEVEYMVEVQIGNQWYEKIEPTASLGHAVRQAKKLISDGFCELDDVRIVKKSLRREVMEIDLS